MSEQSRKDVTAQIVAHGDTEIYRLRAQRDALAAALRAAIPSLEKAAADEARERTNIVHRLRILEQARAALATLDGGK